MSGIFRIIPTVIAEFALLDRVLMAIDSPHKLSDKTAVKVADSPAEHAGHKMSADSTPVSSQQNLDIAKGSRPDTAKLHDFSIETSNNSAVVEKDKSGNITYSRNPDGKGGYTDGRTAPDGTFTAREVQPNGDYTQHVIPVDGSPMTTIQHKQDGKGGFTDTTDKSDGTRKVHEQKPNGEYTDSNYDHGALKNQSRHAADGSPLPPEEVKPAADKSKSPVAPPVDPVGIGANEIDEIGKKIVDKSKDTSFYRNVSRVALGGVGIVANVAQDAPAVLGQAGKIVAAIAESPVTKGISPLISPVLNGAQAIGGIMKEASGNTEGRSDIARAAISWGVGAAVGLLGVETGPADPFIAGTAAIGAGKAYDEMKDGKPITYDEAKQKHDSSWFYKIMEPSEDNWAN